MGVLLFSEIDARDNRYAWHETILFSGTPMTTMRATLQSHGLKARPGDVFGGRSPDSKTFENTYQRAAATLTKRAKYEFLKKKWVIKALFLSVCAKRFKLYLNTPLLTWV